jgi:hypothetical protein
MPNPYLSGRIPVELDKQVDEFLTRTGETKTQMLIKAVSAYIGAEPPPLKVTGDRRIDVLEQEVSELKGAVKSLYEKYATLAPRIENPRIDIEPIKIYDNITDNNDNINAIDKLDHTFRDIDNTVDNSDNHVEIEKTNNLDNITDNNDNNSGVACTTDITPTIEDEKNFINIETSEAARLTKLDPKKFTDLRGGFNKKLKKDNKTLPEKQILDAPIKMTPSSGVKIEKIPYDIFYVGQSKEGKNLWNLVPENTPGEQIPLTFPTDN